MSNAVTQFLVDSLFTKRPEIKCAREDVIAILEFAWKAQEDAINELESTLLRKNRELQEAQNRVTAAEKKVLARYLLFAGHNFYPAGGWSDFHGEFSTVKSATAHYLQHIEEICDKANGYLDSWGHIYDRESKKLIELPGLD